MEYKVIFKDSFLEDLEHLIRRIATTHPSGALKLGELILRMSEGLRFFPERHPKVRQRPGVRRFVVKRVFKVFYRVRHESNTVEVLRCWDGRQEEDPHF